MKSIVLFWILLSLGLFSCKRDDKLHEIEVAKAIKEKELVYNAIDKSWIFPARSLSPESQTISNNWNDWRLFTAELNQKPKGTIGAFQRKTKSLVQKVETLNNSIPEKLNKPQVKSRLMALITKIKALNTFLNVEPIPELKVVQLITDMKVEVNAIQDQIEEIVRRGNIQLEEGEQEMLQSIKGAPEKAEKPTNVQQPQPEE
jgi:hypothetical protein